MARASLIARKGVGRFIARTTNALYRALRDGEVSRRDAANVALAALGYDGPRCRLVLSDVTVEWHDRAPLNPFDAPEAPEAPEADEVTRGD